MYKIMYMVVFGALVVASVLNCEDAQTVHAVGDTIGWSIPPDGTAAYSNWASGDTFKVGDILVFNFVTDGHDVLQVPKDSFDACTTDNAIGPSFTKGPAHVTLNSAGDHYFICTIGNHCERGQKLAITVSGYNDKPPTGANPPSPTPSPKSSPAPPPSAPAAPAGPSGSTSPPGGVTAPPQSRSSSTAVYAGLTLTLASIAIASYIYD